MIKGFGEYDWQYYTESAIEAGGYIYEAIYIDEIVLFISTDKKLYQNGRFKQMNVVMSSRYWICLAY
jgi:hypothetical protein